MPAGPPLCSRRSALQVFARTAGITPWIAAWPQLVQGQALPPTPSCGAGEAPTASQTEGPFYKRSTPQRNSLIEPGMPGERLLLSGHVTTTGCRPLPNTVLDFWQADATGRYDNEGFRLRGHLTTDADGRYRLETIIPGGYPGRTRHIHVKLQPPGGRVLTTQLYFPDEPLNLRDVIYTPALQMTLARGKDAAQGTFHFVVPAA
jgi:protocatechuate 3,4-dioxygenase beta subunit